MAKKESEYQGLLTFYKNSKVKWIKELWDICKLEIKNMKQKAEKNKIKIVNNEEATLKLFSIIYKRIFGLSMYDNPYFTLNSKKITDIILDKDNIVYLCNDLLSMVYFILEDSPPIDLKFDHRKYPPELFQRADEIYKSKPKAKFYYQDALLSAIKEWNEFKNISDESLEFYNMNVSYRQYRTKRGKK